MIQDSIEFTVGILLCGRVREMLDECRFKGMNSIVQREGSGWLSRHWVVKGNPEELKYVQERLRQFIGP